MTTKNCNPSAVDHLKIWAEGLVSEGAFSAIALAGRSAKCEFSAYGSCEDAESLFDLASLTKPFLATTALWLAARGELDLQATVFPEAACWAAPDPHSTQAITLDLLLRHLSGAVAWWPVEVLDQGSVLTPRLWGKERGVYSDIGYMAAARWIEAVTERPLWASVERCFGDLLPGLIANKQVVAAPDIDCAISRVLPCRMNSAKEVDLAKGIGVELPLRRAPELGEVQDGNARFLANQSGILAGHAGLFGTIDAALRLGELWLKGSGSRGFQVQMHQEMDSSLDPREGRFLGWFREAASSAQFFHTGFTGGGIWVDRELGTVRVMLGHRTDPMVGLAPIRAGFLELAQKALNEST